MKVQTLLKKDSFSSAAGRGLVAGIIGGLAGTAVKSLVEHFLPVRQIEQRSAQIKIVDDLSTKIIGSPISIQNEELAEQLVNFPIGASVGAAYGYGKRDDDLLKLKDGIILGSSTWITTHETSFPLMGLEPKPTEIPIRMQMNELLAHVLFGITTEVVRSTILKKLNERN
jgi:putative membrane protein